jgi:hypothetical protein
MVWAHTSFSSAKSNSVTFEAGFCIYGILDYDTTGFSVYTTCSTLGPSARIGTAHIDLSVSRA